MKDDNATLLFECLSVADGCKHTVAEVQKAFAFDTITEKLTLSSTDGNVALIKKLRARLKKAGRGSINIKG